MPENSSYSRENGSLNTSLALDQDSIQSFYVDVCDGNPEIITELIEIYLTSLDDLTRDLVHAQEHKDTTLLRRTAHSLKSSSRIFGSNQLSKNCEILEEMARTGNLADAPAFVARVLDYADQMRHLMRMELRQL